MKFFTLTEDISMEKEQYNRLQGLSELITQYLRYITILGTEMWSIIRIKELKKLEEVKAWKATFSNKNVFRD
jgi:hypothetical protein